MRGNLGPTNHEPLKMKETNVAEPHATRRPSNHGSTLRATQCPHFLTVSVSERGKSMEVLVFVGPQPSKMACFLWLINGVRSVSPLTPD